MSQEKLVVLKDNQELECDVLLSLVCNEIGKAFIAYTDHSKDENGRDNIFVSSYDPNMGVDRLLEITDQREWDLINSIIDKIRNLK